MSNNRLNDRSGDEARDLRAIRAFRDQLARLVEQHADLHESSWEMHGYGPSSVFVLELADPMDGRPPLQVKLSLTEHDGIIADPAAVSYGDQSEDPPA